ncbi:hypothetical protein BLNAU_14730 [Blattamonas nauphoetae]|uniref:Uncharacterized protein n=1 Tax=Blattamonas nauphoetae TaxID=2049346 RepID=A0ABQ9XHK3_9EUKA|nr:hypothetical protein BLNAU_14730 [Blattamonas nauphoetae]
MTLKDPVVNSAQSNHNGLLKPIPVTSFIAPTVFISDNGGSDSSSCLSYSPCLSFSKAQQEGVSAGYILNIQSSTTWKVNCVVTKPVTIQSDNGNKATLNLRNVTAAEDSNLRGFLRIAEATRLDTIVLVLFQATTRVPFVTLTSDATLTISNIEIKTHRTSGEMECTFQPAFSVRSGQLVIESLSFTTNPEFDAYPPIQLIGGSLVDESENEVAMEVDYFGDRGWIEVEGDTTTSMYPDLKLKKWTFRGSSSPKKSHGLWLKNVEIGEWSLGR